MIWIIGLLFDKVSYYIGRFRSYYCLHQFGNHGSNVHVENGCNITSQNVYVGDNVFIGGGATFVSTGAKIIIGNNVMFGPNVSIVTGNHRIDLLGKLMVDVAASDKRPSDDEDVVIDDDCWIGIGAIILKGVHIGKGSVIGAGTIISKNVEPYSIVITGRSIMVKKRFSDDEIIQHEKLISRMSKSNES